MGQRKELKAGDTCYHKAAPTLELVFCEDDSHGEKECTVEYWSETHMEFRSIHIHKSSLVKKGE